MNRIKYIEAYCDKERIGDNSVLYALIRCLDETDAVKLLQKSLTDNLLLRHASLKVVLERSSESWTELYDDLIEYIIKVFSDLPPNRRGSAFYCLGEIAKHAPPTSRAVVLEFLLSSRYAVGRRKGLSTIKTEEIPAFRNKIERCAFDYREPKAVLLMIQNFAPEYLYEKRADIMSTLDAGWAVGRLYLRAAEHDPQCINELRNIDGITFAYAKAKLNEILPEDELMSLVEAFCHDERLGLLVWSIGKMKHWGILEYIAEHYDEWQTERILTVPTEV